MADFGFPFRRETGIDPYILPVRPAGQEIPVRVDRIKLNTLRCRSFELVNLAPVTIWLRGWNDPAAMPEIAYKGHVLPPLGAFTKSTQFPDWVAAVCTAEEGAPIFGTDGKFLYPEARAVLTYGTGL